MRRAWMAVMALGVVLFSGVAHADTVSADGDNVRAGNSVYVAAPCPTSQYIRGTITVNYAGTSHFSVGQSLTITGQAVRSDGLISTSYSLLPLPATIPSGWGTTKTSLAVSAQSFVSASAMPDGIYTVTVTVKSTTHTATGTFPLYKFCTPGADGTPPSISVTAPSAWSNAPVTATVSASDNLALGSVTCTPAAASTVTDPVVTFSSTVSVATEGTTNVSCTATDMAPTTRTASAVVRVDLTPPVLACDATPVVVRNENGTVSATVTDSMSGAAAASVSTTVTSNRVGTFNATLTGHDLAGNAASVQCPYVVVSEVQVGSFYGALAAPGFRFRGGLTVPVRFDLRDPSGVVLSDAASQALAAAGSVVVALDSGPAQLAQYRAAEDQFRYRWATVDLPAGSYTVWVRVLDTDGSVLSEKSVVVDMLPRRNVNWF